MIEPGHRIDKYEVQRRLGRGAASSVCLAHDAVLERLVAVRLFPGDLAVVAVEDLRRQDPTFTPDSRAFDSGFMTSRNTGAPVKRASSGAGTTR